ncbi:MAG: LPS export ABC transporter permease LptG [Gammaproteobacteria bacterium]
MNVLTFYIVREILKGSLISWVLLLTLINLFTFSDELKSLGTGNYGLKEIFYYLALTSPRVMYELMPSSALIGSLFILGAMGNNRELIAMKASGWSVPNILTAVMAAGAVLVLIAVLIGEFIAPTTERQAQVLKVTAKNQQIIKHTRYGLWLREGKKFINIRQIEDNGKLSDISIYDLNDTDRLGRLTHAERGVFLGKQTWKLLNVKTSDISINKITAGTRKDQILKSSIAPDILKIAVVSPDNLSLVDLAVYIDFLKDNRQKSHIFEMAFWGRIVNPLITFVMLLVSTPFVIGIKRGVSVGGRMIIGVVIGLGFDIFDKIVGHIGLIYDLNPPLIAFAPSIFVMSIAIYALRRANRGE